MINFQVTGLDTSNHHKCYPEQEGDWLVFRCPICPDYERRIHLKTHTVKIKIHPDNDIPHLGLFVSTGLQLADQHYHPN